MSVAATEQINPRVQQKPLYKRALAQIISPDVYDFWARELGSTAAWERCFARIVECKEAAADTISLRLKPNSNFAGFEAGQHVNVSVFIAGRRVTRTYSLSNIPADGLIEITVRRDPNGLMSQWLHDNAHSGTVLELGAVFGDMTLNNVVTDSASPLLMLAAGSGITPMMSLIRQLSEQSYSGDAMMPTVQLLYWESSAERFCFRDELIALAETHKHFSVSLINSSESGRLSATQLAKQVQELTGTTVLSCGSDAFVSTARELLQPQAVAFHAEAFTPPLLSEAANESTNRVDVELLRSGRTVSLSTGQTLLEGLEAAGVAVESGCRMGICNTCACGAQGAVQDIQNSETTLSNGGPVRLCVSRAVDAIKLDL